MPILETLTLLATIVGAWFWYDTVSARDLAVEAAREACDVEGFQLLDDTVATTLLRPVRDDNGRLRLKRIYGFEYSDTGDNRRKGSVTLIGREVVALYVRPRLVVHDGVLRNGTRD